ncbi:PTS lactose transporter subunit IIA [Erysipelothrix larvae]|uniref:PTS lactose transporter subunit IIA n=1 Tax=Erysipelothrix larvae TaxID=1514105 RepID=A0A0X8GYW0_9FIRM|nr:PTS lactose/cellobiose transporter subunit IIA [Erysipelothrix larvae]AMC92963.1 PTS lactose transporter subunit IIA [Erysipelothrix larvae]
MNEQEQSIFQMISSAGDSKGKAFEALKCVKQGDYEQARLLLKESRKLDIEAHKVQTELITKELSGESKTAISLLMVHAQDHYMTSQLAHDLIDVLVDIFEGKES